MAAFLLEIQEQTEKAQWKAADVFQDSGSWEKINVCAVFQLIISRRASLFSSQSCRGYQWILRKILQGQNYCGKEREIEGLSHFKKFLLRCTEIWRWRLLHVAKGQRWQPSCSSAGLPAAGRLPLGCGWLQHPSACHKIHLKKFMHVISPPEDGSFG